ncbi:MAG: tRNA 4-thiouridine(8) synthase ThiI [Bacilli bacterium]|jgi:thiamine biosynthesis protein ThiI|nr:tRNA 4-thiouridine(8) synthase ThiI [Bacilli bacterium]
MSGDYLMIHYGELSTKGENRKSFISQLARNVRHALKDYGSPAVTSGRDHAFVALESGAPAEAIVRKLQDVSGIQKISLVHKCPKDIETVEKTALDLVKGESGQTFKVKVKRADKSYPLDSYGLACAVGDFLLENSALAVDVHEPDITLNLEMRKEACYLYAHSYPGAGGYPLGMNGKALMLLSGGIDSPVASYLLLRRGIRIECLHFAAPPYTSSAVIDKLLDILKILNGYQEEIKLDIVPFTKLQEAIYEHVDEPYCITIMRRMMMRIAHEVALKDHCLALATGESVGQVASQTLDSMVAINAVTNFPIIRPLAVSDKLQIIGVSQKIGTYGISIRPYEDCCTIFAPKKPKTKPKVDECEAFEGKFDWKPLVEECVAGVKSILMKNGAPKDFGKKSE